jgi:hypothetical protein
MGYVFWMCTRVNGYDASEIRPSQHGHLIDPQGTPDSFHIFDVSIEAESRTVDEEL